MPVRLRVPAGGRGAAPVVMHLHGGAFIGGSLDGGRTVAKLLAMPARSWCRPIIRSRPSILSRMRWKRLPTLNWLHKSRASLAGRRSSVFVAGEEAGGNLAASLALMARDQQTPPLAGQILISPMLDPCMATCSMREAEAGAAGCAWADGWHAISRHGRQGGPSLRGAARLVAARGPRARARAHRAGRSAARRKRRLCAAAARMRVSRWSTHVLAGPTGWPCALVEAPSRCERRGIVGAAVGTASRPSSRTVDAQRTAAVILSIPA